MPTLVPVEHDPFSIAAAVGLGRPAAVGLERPAHVLSSYEPTWRDRVAALLMGDERASPARTNFVSGLMGSTGLGSTGLGLIDFTPAGIPLAVQENAKQGDITGAAVAATPFGVAARPVQAAAKDVARGIRAYHASPYEFEKFDMSKVGTGEGKYYPQYVGERGMGMYFTESPEAAEAYRKMLREEGSIRKSYGGLPKAHVYETELNVSPKELLDFGGKPKASLAREFGLDPKTATGEDLFKAAGTVGQNFDPQLATDVLKDIGFKGTTYVDRQAHVPSAEGVKNYVLFDDKLIDIVKKYGVAGLTAAGLGDFAGKNVLIPVDHDPFH